MSGFFTEDEIRFNFYLGSTSPTILMPIEECTQAEYDAMDTHDSGTLYAIEREVE